MLQLLLKNPKNLRFEIIYMLQPFQKTPKSQPQKWLRQSQLLAPGVDSDSEPEQMPPAEVPKAAALASAKAEVKPEPLALVENLETGLEDGSGWERWENKKRG